MPELEDIEEAAQVPVLSVLPEDISVLEALSKTMPVTLHKPKANASIEYKKLAACLIGERYEDPRLWSKLESIFKKDVTKDNINRLIAQNERNPK